jgi:hypothetical protein
LDMIREELESLERGDDCKTTHCFV